MRSLATRVLAIFVATICATLLAPVIASSGYALVCSAQGTYRIAADHAGGDPTSLPSERHDDPLAHCPLCMPAGAPPTVAAWDSTPVEPLAHVRQVIPAARLAGLVGAPLPARGPPLVS